VVTFVIGQNRSAVDDFVVPFCGKTALRAISSNFFRFGSMTARLKRLDEPDQMMISALEDIGICQWSKSFLRSLRYGNVLEIVLDP